MSEENKLTSIPRKPLDQERIKSVIDVVTAGLGLQKVLIVGVAEDHEITLFPAGFSGPVEIAGIMEVAKFSVLISGRQQ